MDNYLISATRRPRGFTVLDATGKTLANAVYPGHFSMNVTGTLDTRSLQITGHGTWRRHYIIAVDGVEVGLLRTGRWGGMRIEIARHGQAPIELELGRPSIWKHVYALSAGKDLVLIELRPVFNWRSFGHDLHVRLVGQGIAAEQLPLLVTVCGFGVRLMMARHAAAAAA